MPESDWSSLILTSAITVVTITLVVLAMIIGILWYRQNHVRNVPPQLPAEPPPGLESRLSEIDSLLAAGRIDDAEHAAMRSRILDLQ